MAGPRNSSANKAYVEVKLPENFVSDLIGKLNVLLDKESMSIAEDIKTDAQASTAFEDYTGTARESEWHKQHFPNARTIRQRITARRSKYPGGGAIVVASAPHAHLVEFGHVLAKNGKVIGRVKEHPFLRPAKEKRMTEATQRLAEALQQGLENA